MATTAVSSGTSTTTTPTTTTTGSSSTSSVMTADQLAAANKASAQQIISSLGSGSGVDVSSLAKNLVSAEQTPFANAINAKIAKNDAKVSGISAVMFMASALKDAMTAIKDKDSFNSLAVTNSNTSALGVSAAGSAASGQHAITINSLSQAQRSISPGFASATTSLNGGNSFAITLAGNNPGVSNGTPDGVTSSNITTLAGPTFGASPSVNDFKNFSITVASKTIGLTPAPSTATVTDLAKDLQKQLQTIDGSSDLTVTVQNGTDLVFTSASGRTVASPTLSTSTIVNLDNGAAVGAASDSTITGAAFGINPSVNDFRSFTVNIGGTARTIVPAPTKPTMSSLADSLQFQLRALDGSDDLSVSYANSVLTVSSALGKSITGIGLTSNVYADSPQGVVDAINNGNRGYKAQLINDGSATPFKMMITGANGSTEGFSVSSTDAAGAVGASFATPTGYSASDANLTVDGISYSRKSNSVSDIIPGVTFTLKGATTSAASISLDRDTTDLKTRLNAVVTAYNDFNNIVNETTNPKSTLGTYGATLVGDSTVKMVRQQIRSLLFSNSTTPGKSISSLSQVGYSLDMHGVLTLDATKLDTALQNNFDDVTKLFTGGYNNLSTYSTLSAGYAGDAVKKLTTILSNTGPLVTKTNNANTQSDGYRTQLTSLQTRMDALLARYQKQFASMDSLVGKTNSQKTSLKATFDGMMATYTGKTG
jgi:flagellar hook-associated protein 2